MQELRFVLIVVGALAIGALLFHGLWTSKKEGKSKFSDKPLNKIDLDKDDEPASNPSRGFAPEDDFEIIKKERKEPDFSISDTDVDPLIDNYQPQEESSELDSTEEDIPSFNAERDDLPDESETEIIGVVQEPDPIATTQSDPLPTEVNEPSQEPEMEVIVLNVHCAGETPFIGSKLFDSMQQNGLLYGDMDIFHRHADMSGTGKVLFSVANMMQPGTLKHDDPEQFTTKGISFFMTLPCFGEADQNFKLMLKTAQQIADDLGANVLDDGRNLMTPDRLAAYRKQIQQFGAA